ncbi:MAG TPA: M23 family metallopeptidase [Methylomusa anaerophila]|uniref:M23 family metallopeptidase n=1 Tax=Methylomusa anaerophila TaxID=1930071 RepID=UPI002BA7FDE2|nr:M23 family metallopeptidase [Methylomusa anaerophila]HML89528.1 M23 family metallopeptidase [Methylomusa anaerophila]
MIRYIWRSGGIEAKPVFTAATLLILAAILAFFVISVFQAEKEQLLLQKVQPIQNPEPPVISSEISEINNVPATLPSSTPVTAAETGDIEQKIPAGGPGNADDSSESIHRLLNGNVILAFGWQEHPLFKDWRYHTGVDLAAAEGQAVPAFLPGEVIDVNTDKHLGLTVVVKSEKYAVYYGSIATASVSKGDRVATGMQIGLIGAAAGEKYGPHLHLGVKSLVTDTYINPAEIFPEIKN